MEYTNRKSWKIGYINIAKAVNDIENKDDVAYFLQSMFISTKGLTKDLHEFCEKVQEACNDLLNEKLMLQKQESHDIK